MNKNLKNQLENILSYIGDAQSSTEDADDSIFADNEDDASSAIKDADDSLFSAYVKLQKVIEN